MASSSGKEPFKYPIDGELRFISRKRWKWLLLKKRIDPSFLVRISPDEIPIIYDRKRMVATNPPVVTVERFLIIRKYVDHNSRIVARSDYGSREWIFGLFLGLLKRQVKEGSPEVRAWCYERILEYESDPTAQNWYRYLLMLDDSRTV